MAPSCKESVSTSVEGGGSTNLTLFDLLRCTGSSVSAEDCKIHLAVNNGQQDPLDLFLAGDFEVWQCEQTKKNFERGYVLSLIQLPAREQWLFAGCYRVIGCEAGDEAAPFRYQTEIVEGLEELTGRLVVRFRREGRQSYLNAERWVDGLLVHELRPERMVGQEFPGFKHVRITKSELDVVVSQSIESWRSALSSVAGVYLITDRNTGKLYVGSATGDGGIWKRWVEYHETGHAGNKRLIALLAEEGPAYSSHFQFSVLEIADTHADQVEVLARESHWKDVLGAREFGLNGN